MRPVTGAGGYRMSETQPIGIHQAIRHQADLIPFGQRFHDGVPVNLNWLFQNTADSRTVIQAAAYSPQLAFAGQARQGLVNGGMASDLFFRAFPRAEAERRVRRVRLVFTPRHGSWLNRA